MSQKQLQDKQKPNMQPYQRDLRCPVHKCLLGRYDSRIGTINTTLYCPKCGMEYTFTLEREKNN